jgi:bifunctional NMN adenylyltransferase/nudix hydrolase
MTEHVNFGVYVGRFSPFHKAHEAIIRGALEKCDTLLICFGSHSASRTKKDPWYAIERIRMIKKCFTPEELKRIKFHPLINYGDMGRWIGDILLFAENFMSDGDTIGIFGCTKDESSWYLKEFPEPFVKMYLESPLLDNLSATDIREQYFKHGVVDQSVLPSGVVEYLSEHIGEIEYDKL